MTTATIMIISWSTELLRKIVQLTKHSRCHHDGISSQSVAYHTEWMHWTQPGRGIDAPIVQVGGWIGKTEWQVPSRYKDGLVRRWASTCFLIITSKTAKIYLPDRENMSAWKCWQESWSTWLSVLIQVNLKKNYNSTTITNFFNLPKILFYFWM